MNIKKIRNIQFVEPDDRLDQKWIDVKSFKNRLLYYSDWIFVDDIKLDDASKQQWINWRSRIRELPNSPNDKLSPEQTLEILKQLELNKPEIHYLAKNVENLTVYKKHIKILLSEKIEEYMVKLRAHFGPFEIVNEKYNEAVKFLNTKDKSVLLLLSNDKHTLKLELKDIITKAIENKQDYLAILFKLDNFRLNSISKLESLETIEECDKLLDEIKQVSLKQWISI